MKAFTVGFEGDGDSPMQDRQTKSLEGHNHLFTLILWKHWISNPSSKVLSVAFGPTPPTCTRISSPRLRTRTGRLFGLLARSIPASVKEGKTRHDQPFPISHPWHGTSTVASFSYGACFSARCPLVTRRAFPDEFSAYGDFESIPCPSGGQGFYNICYSHRFLFLFRFL